MSITGIIFDQSAPPASLCIINLGQRLFVCHRGWIFQKGNHFRSDLFPKKSNQINKLNLLLTRLELIINYCYYDNEYTISKRVDQTPEMSTTFISLSSTSI